MARIIECDRCHKRLKEEQICKIAFHDKNTANTFRNYELCERCYDHVKYEADQAPPQPGRLE